MMAATTFLRLAEVGIGAVAVGVPAAGVVQAVPLPALPAALPRHRGALVGVIDFEGRLIPVVDLARWVDLGAVPDDAARFSNRRVLILRDGGCTIGLQVDSVGGLVEVPAHAVTRLHHDDDPDEVFHSAARLPEDGRIMSLLDARRLARLAAVWRDDGPDGDHAARATPADARADTPMRAHALLRAGAARLAVPAAALAEVIPMPALERFGGGLEAAYSRWRGRHLPVLAPAALGLAPAPDGAPPALLAVVERAGAALGIPVDAVLRLHDFDDGGLAAPDGLTAGAFDDEGRPVRLLDDARLFARFPEAELSRDVDMDDPRDARAPGRPVHAVPAPAQAAANAGAYIVFEADGLCATAIDAVERILDLDEATSPEPGTMAWEGRVIALRDLRPAPAAGAGHVMVVRSAGACVGYTVARVHVLVPPGTGRLYRMGAGSRAVDFITTAEGDGQASYRIVDLAAAPATRAVA